MNTHLRACKPRARKEIIDELFEKLLFSFNLAMKKKRRKINFTDFFSDSQETLVTTMFPTFFSPLPDLPSISNDEEKVWIESDCD